MTSVESLLKGCNRTVTGRDQIEYGLMGAYTTATPAVTSASRQVCCCGKGVGKGREAPSCITLQGKKCASACRSLPATPPTLLVWTLHPLHWCLSLDFGTAEGHKFTRCQPHFQQLLECSLCCVSPAAFCKNLKTNWTLWWPSYLWHCCALTVIDWPTLHEFSQNSQTN